MGKDWRAHVEVDPALLRPIDSLVTVAQPAKAADTVQDAILASSAFDIRPALTAWLARASEAEVDVLRVRRIRTDMISREQKRSVWISSTADREICGPFWLFSSAWQNFKAGMNRCRLTAQLGLVESGWYRGRDHASVRARGKPATLGIVRRAFQSAGVEFIDENGSGPGVRLRKLGDGNAAEDLLKLVVSGRDKAELLLELTNAAKLRCEFAFLNAASEAAA